MPAKSLFQIHMALGYVAWALCVARYIWPRLRAIDRVDALRAIATLHSFRFFGLAFLLPGFVGPALPGAFGAPAAYGDFVTALLAMAVLLTARVRVLFWPLVWAFNVFGAADLIMATIDAVRVDLPSVAGQLGAAYAIVILYVPLLFITHGVGFALLLRPAYAPARSAAVPTLASVPVIAHIASPQATAGVVTEAPIPGGLRAGHPPEGAAGTTP